MSKGEYNHQIEYGMDIEQQHKLAKPDEISPHSLPSDAVDKYFMPPDEPDEKLREEILGAVCNICCRCVSPFSLTRMCEFSEEVKSLLALLPQIRREAIIERIMRMPHDTTHCEIIQILKEE